VEVDLEKVVTNIVIFDVSRTGKTSGEICAQLKDKGVLAIGFGSAIRMVTHCGVTSDGVETTIGAMREILGRGHARAL